MSIMVGRGQGLILGLVLDRVDGDLNGDGLNAVLCCKGRRRMIPGVLIVGMT